jgi:hypothetical protein
LHSQQKQLEAPKEQLALPDHHTTDATRIKMDL